MDALCVFGDVKQADLRIIRELSDKPIVLISYAASLTDYRTYELGGIKVLLNGHHAFEDSVTSMFNAYQSVFFDNKGNLSAKEILSKYVNASKLDDMAKRYMSL